MLLISIWIVLYAKAPCRQRFPFPPPGLPDENGRKQIFNIHTTRMRNMGKLDDGVDLGELAAETKNFSGAEIEGVVRAAQSTALNRMIKVSCTIV